MTLTDNRKKDDFLFHNLKYKENKSSISFYRFTEYIFLQLIKIFRNNILMATLCARHSNTFHQFLSLLFNQINKSAAIQILTSLITTS